MPKLNKKTHTQNQVALAVAITASLKKRNISLGSELLSMLVKDLTESGVIIGNKG